MRISIHCMIRSQIAVAGVVATSLVVCSIVEVLAQSSSTSAARDQSSDSSVRMQAVSTQVNCSDRRMYVAAWISNLAFARYTGTRQGSYCVDYPTSGNASTTLGGLECGAWNGHSRHHYVQSGTWVDLPNRDPYLWAGNCQEIACQVLGPEYYWNGSECVYTPGSPIIIATRQGVVYRLTSPAEGVWFDIDGDGAPERVAWTAPDSDIAFLALDRDGDSQITSGNELFGNHTLAGSPNGFDALMKMAMGTNGGIRRGSVSSDDPVFASLLLWTDRNHNGISEPSELQPASRLLSEIGLGYGIHMRRDQFGNLYRFRGWATIRTAPGRNRADGPDEEKRRQRVIYDVIFQILP